MKEEDILKRWDQFIYTHHYKYTNNFLLSYFGMFPGRSCETVFATYQFNFMPDSSRGFRGAMSWDAIKDGLCELFVEEKETPEDKNFPS